MTDPIGRGDHPRGYPDFRPPPSIGEVARQVGLIVSAIFVVVAVLAVTFAFPVGSLAYYIACGAGGASLLAFCTLALSYSCRSRLPPMGSDSAPHSSARSMTEPSSSEGEIRSPSKGKVRTHSSKVDASPPSHSRRSVEKKAFETGLDEWLRGETILDRQKRIKEKFLACFRGESNVLNLFCNLLTALPPEIGQLTTLETLNLACNQLTALPPEIGQLTALKRLNLIGNHLTALPAEIGQLTALETLNLEGNQLTALPNTLLELPSTCGVYLTNNPLSQRILDNLRAATQASDYRGPFIYFSVHEERAEDSRTAIEIYGDICKLAEKTPVTLKALLKNEVTLHAWLSRLSYIGDFKHSSPKQKALAEAIADYIEKAENEPEFRDSFFSVIDGAGATCGDRMALSLLHLDINFQISESLKKPDLEKLACLILHGTYALDQLQAAAAEKTKTLRFVDEIEIYLAYPIKLKESLQLPIVLDTMLYFSCSGVEEKDLKAAKELVFDTLSNKEACYGKLVESETWERALKTNDTKEYANLETARDTLSKEEKYTEAQEGFKAGLLDLTKSVLGSWRPPLYLSGKEKRSDE